MAGGSLQVIGSHPQFSSVVEGWIEDLEQWLRTAREGSPPDFVFSDATSSGFFGHLEDRCDPVMVYPGPARKLTEEAAGRLATIGSVVGILSDELPDELPNGWMVSVWPHVRERVVFPPIGAKKHREKIGNLLVVEDVEHPMLCRLARQPGRPIDWARLGQALGQYLDTDVRVLPSGSSDDAIAAAVAQSSVVLVSSSDADTANRVACLAWRGGATLVAGRELLNACRIMLQDSVGLSTREVPVEWDSLRDAISVITPHAAGRAAIDPGEWVEKLPCVADAPSDSFAVLQRSFRSFEPIDGSGKLRRVHAAWRAGIDQIVAAGNPISKERLVALAEWGIYSEELTPVRIRGLAADRLKVVAVLEAMAGIRPDLAGRIGRSLFDGVCGGVLIDWRREAAEAAARVYGSAGPALDAEGRSGAAIVCLALGQVDEAARWWSIGGFDTLRLVTLWAVLRAWLPEIESGCGIVPAAIHLWKQWFVETQRDAGRVSGAPLVEALSRLYLGAPVGSAGSGLDQDCLRRLSASDGAALSLFAWLLKRSDTVRMVWEQARGEPVPATAAGLFPVAVCRALFDRDRSAATLLDQIVAREPDFFAPAVPANTRGFFHAVARVALGDTLQADHWRRFALAHDPVAAVRDRHFERIGEGHEHG